MYLCEKNYECCNYRYWDRFEDVGQDARECGHLVEVAPVIHAHWIGRNNACIYDDWRCSNCGYYSETRNKTRLNKYCGECGARMDGDAE